MIVNNDRTTVVEMVDEERSREHKRSTARSKKVSDGEIFDPGFSYNFFYLVPAYALDTDRFKERVSPTTKDLRITEDDGQDIVNKCAATAHDVWRAA